MVAYPVVGSFGWSPTLKAYIDAYGAASTNMGANLGASSGTDDTAAINAILATSPGLVRGFPGQTYLISTPLIIKSNTTLDLTGCTMQLKPSSACNMINNTAVSTIQRTIAGTISAGSANFTLTTGTASSADVGRTFVITAAGFGSGTFTHTAKVATFTDATHVVLDTVAPTAATAQSTNVFDRDSNIRIIGGTWDRGNNNGGAGSLQHSMFFRHIDGLVVDIDRFISTGTGPKFAVTPADVTKFWLRVRDFNHVSDGIHVRGPASKGVIWGTGGTTTDDMVVLGASDGSRISEGAGNISDVQIHTLTPINLTTNHVKLYGTTGSKVSNVRIRGVSGGVGGKACAIGATDQVGVTLEDITVSDITCDHPTPILVNGSGTNLRIRDITGTDAVGTDVATVVSVIAGQTWDKISISGLHAPNMSSTAAGGSMVQVNGTVTTLLVDDVKFSAQTSGCLVLLNNAASSVSRLFLSNIEQFNGGAPIKAATATHTLSEVWYDNVYVNGAAFIGDFATTTTVHLAGVTSTSLANNTFNARATASLKIYGEGNVLSSTLGVTAGAVVSSYSSDLPYSASAGAVPTVTAGAAAGASPTVSVVGNDRSGTITVTQGTTPLTGTLVTLTLTRTLASAVRQVLLIPSTTKAAGTNPYVTSKATTGFAVGVQTAATAADSLTFDYLVIA